MNKLMKNYLLIILVFLSMSIGSCTPSPPYEIKSPCVAADSDNPYGINPCARVPANMQYSVS